MSSPIIISTLVEPARVIYLYILVCHEECGNCSEYGRNKCTSCSEGKVLLDGQCLNECLPGYYRYYNTCLPCISPCLACNSEVECIRCSFPFYLNEYKCIGSNDCPNGTYEDKSLGICSLCSVGCLTCYVPTTYHCY